MPLHGPAPPSGEYIEPAIQRGGQLGRAHRCDPRRRQLDRQWHPVETATHLTDRRRVRCAEREVCVRRASALHEQLYRIGRADGGQIRIHMGDRESGNREQAFAVESKPFPTRGQHDHPLTRTDDLLDQIRDRVQHVLTVVDHQQQLLRPQKLRQRLFQCLSRPGGYAERGGERIDHIVGIAHRRQFDQPDAVPEPGQHLRGDLQRQTCLADTTYPRQRHNSSLAQRVNRALDLALPADERAHPQRQVPRRRVERHQDGEVAHQARMYDLEHMHRAGKIAQAMLTQISQRHVVGKRSRHERLDRLRHQQLAAVCHTHQPGTPIQRRTEIVTVAELRLTRMQAHPHRQHLEQQNLRGDRGRYRIGRRSEHRSHPIARVLEEMPAVLVDQPAQDVVVLGQQRPHRLRIVLPSTRRTLNIRE